MLNPLQHFSYSAQLRHDCLELFEYYEQLCLLFDSQPTAAPRKNREKDGLLALQQLSTSIDELQQYASESFYPMLLTDESEQSVVEGLKGLTIQSRQRLENLQSELEIYYPCLSYLLRGAFIAPKKKSYIDSWQDLSFDIDLILSSRSSLERSELNKAIHLSLAHCFGGQLWTAHRAHQKIGSVLDHLHLMVSKLQTLVRLKTAEEEISHDSLYQLIRLKDCLKDFEIKTIKQKSAEEYEQSYLRASSKPSKK
jgi:hypothetical protein